MLIPWKYIQKQGEGNNSDWINPCGMNRWQSLRDTTPSIAAQLCELWPISVKSTKGSSKCNRPIAQNPCENLNRKTSTYEDKIARLSRSFDGRPGISSLARRRFSHYQSLQYILTEPIVLGVSPLAGWRAANNYQLWLKLSVAVTSGDSYRHNEGHLVLNLLVKSYRQSGSSLVSYYPDP